MDDVLVRYVGTRHNRMRIRIWVSGDIFSPGGYVFGRGLMTQRMSRAEAEVLTGVTPQIIANNTVVTGWRIDGHLSPDVAKDEKFVIEE